LFKDLIVSLATSPLEVIEVSTTYCLGSPALYFFLEPSFSINLEALSINLERCNLSLRAYFREKEIR